MATTYSQSAGANDGPVRRYNRTDPCRRCQTGTKGCSADSGLIRCRDQVPSGLSRGQVVDGLVYLGQARGDPQWALFKESRGGLPAARRQRPRGKKPEGEGDCRSAPPAILTLPEEEADFRHKVYRGLLDLMSLSGPHRNALLARGLTAVQIKTRSYKSVPNFKKRCEFARALEEKFGVDAFQVPGIGLFKSKKHPETTYPSLYPGPGSRLTGIVIPVLDRRGRVVALRVRVDQEEPTNKYRWFRFSENAKPKAFVHWGWPWNPAKEPDWKVNEVRVTEGELKAGIAAMRTNVLTLSIPGVSNWRLLRPELEHLKTRGLKRILIALDQDEVPKPAVF